MTIAVALTMIVACSKKESRPSRVKHSGESTVSGIAGKVVNWRALTKYLPKSIGAWTATGSVHGDTRGLSKMTITEVSRRYTRGSSSVYVQITDTVFAPFLRAEFAPGASARKDSGSGLTKKLKVGGHRAVLEWRSSDRRSTVKVLIGGRFLVLARVRKAPNPDAAAAFAGRLALGEIGSVR